MPPGPPRPAAPPGPGAAAAARHLGRHRHAHPGPGPARGDQPAVPADPGGDERARRGGLSSGHAPAGPCVRAAGPGGSGADSRGRGDRPQRALSARRGGAAGRRPYGTRPGGRAQPGTRPGRPAQADRGPLGPAGRRGDRAHLRRRARRRRRRPDHPERPAVQGGWHRGHRSQPALPEPLLHQWRRLSCVSAGPGPAFGRHQHRPGLDHRAAGRRWPPPRTRWPATS